MKLLPLALLCCLSVVPVACPAQQAASPAELREEPRVTEQKNASSTIAPPILLIYVEKPNSAPLIPRIALGLVKPDLQISSFLKNAQTTETNTGNKMQGLAVQLKPEDAKILSAALVEIPAANSQDFTRPVWFVTPDRKILAGIAKYIVKNAAGNDGVLMFSATEDTPIYNYLSSMVIAN